MGESVTEKLKHFAADLSVLIKLKLTCANDPLSTSPKCVGKDSHV